MPIWHNDSLLPGSSREASGRVRHYPGKGERVWACPVFPPALSRVRGLQWEYCTVSWGPHCPNPGWLEEEEYRSVTYASSMSLWEHWACVSISLPSSVLILVLLWANELGLGPFLPSKRSLTCVRQWGFYKFKSITFIYSSTFKCSHIILDYDEYKRSNLLAFGQVKRCVSHSRSLAWVKCSSFRWYRHAVNLLNHVIWKLPVDFILHALVIFIRWRRALEEKRLVILHAFISP